MKVSYQTTLAAAAVLLFCAAARADETSVEPKVADAATAALATATSASVALMPAAPGPSSLASADAGAATPVPATSASVASVTMPSEDSATYFDDMDPLRDFDARVGGWAVHQTGSPTKVDEYQSGNSSPFFDIEGIMSNGDRSLDLSVIQTDDVDQNMRAHYYGGPQLEANVIWEQFPHQLDQSYYPGWNYLDQNNTVGPLKGGTPPQTPQNIVLYTRNNLAPSGQDYAIDVQEFKANFKGNLTDNLTWRVDVFGIDKEGDRQVNEFQHCSSYAANGSTGPNGTPLTAANTANVTNQCHVVSQAQHIDWETDEATVSLHMKLGCDSALEYQHLARQFTANDQDVYFPYGTGVGSYSVNTHYTSTVPGNPLLATSAGYAIVPDTETQIDRLKFTTAIGACTDAYLLGYAGYNEDQMRDTYRNFQGTDLRITNKSLDTLTVTAYGKYYHEDTTNPTFTLSQNLGTAAAPYAPQNDYYQDPTLNYFSTPGTGAASTYIGPEINRQLTAFGIDGRWCPCPDSCSIFASRLAIVSGYEYSSLERQNAMYFLNAQPAGQSGQFYSNNVFTQPDTDQNTWTLGVENRWTCNFNTFLRYKYIQTDYPLYGVTNNVGYEYAYALNSNMPTQENRVELGGTWTPTDCLMINGTIYVENAYNNAFNNAPGFTPWTSNSVPFTFSAWWRPVCDWSFNFGASEMDSWINQSVNLSNLSPSAVPVTVVGPPANGPLYGPVLNLPWKYVSTADVLTLGFRYQATCKLSFTGLFEYVRGTDENFATYNPASEKPGTPPATWAYYGYPGTPVTVVNGAVVPNTAVNIGQYSLVKMNSYRLELGADYRLSQNVTTFARFDYYDYEDDTGLDSGQQNMFMVGASAKF